MCLLSGCVNKRENYKQKYTIQPVVIPCPTTSNPPIISPSVCSLLPESPTVSSCLHRTASKQQRQQNSSYSLSHWAYGVTWPHNTLRSGSSHTHKESSARLLPRYTADCELQHPQQAWTEGRTHFSWHIWLLNCVNRLISARNRAFSMLMVNSSDDHKIQYGCRSRIVDTVCVSAAAVRNSEK